MPRLSIFLIQYSSGALIPRTGLTNVFLQPQPAITSTNPASKSADSDSVVLIESPTSPGIYYADIVNPAPRYDLYIAGVKDSDFCGSQGFNITASKSIFFKRNVQINANAYATPQVFTVGTSPLATPDGGQTWPKFSIVNLPLVFVLPPSELIGGLYAFRIVKLVRDSVAVDGSGILSFSLSLDPNGPELPLYYFDLMIVMP